jgi:hypothetical protein
MCRRLGALLGPCCLLSACGSTASTPPPIAMPLPPDTPILFVRGKLPPSVQSRRVGPITVAKPSDGRAEGGAIAWPQNAAPLVPSPCWRSCFGVRPWALAGATPPVKGIAVRIMAPIVQEAATLAERKGTWC